MRERPSVVDRLHRWSGRLRTAAVSTVVAAAALLPVAPAMPASGTGPAPDATIAADPAVHAPAPSATTDGPDPSPPTGGAATGPHGHPADVTTVVGTCHSAPPDIATTRAQPSAPIVTGPTRAPPERTAHPA